MKKDLKEKYRRQGHDAARRGDARECPYKRREIVAVWEAAFDERIKIEAERTAAANERALKEIDEQIARHEQQLADLRQRRARVLERGAIRTPWGVQW